MAEKLDPRQVVTFEELLRAMMFEMEGYTANTGAEGPADQRGGVGGGQSGKAGDGRETGEVKVKPLALTPLPQCGIL